MADTRAPMGASDTIRLGDEVVRRMAFGSMRLADTRIWGGALAQPGGVAAEVAAETGSTPAQVALAWLLARADVICPNPGTSSIAHLEENIAAAGLRLTDEQVARLTAGAEPTAR